jgi:hypothetical protein
LTLAAERNFLWNRVPGYPQSVKRKTEDENPQGWKQISGQGGGGVRSHRLCTGHPGKCEEPYTREEAVEDRFAAALKEIAIPLAVLKLLRESVSESDLNEQAARDRELKRLEEQHPRLVSKRRSHRPREV